MVRMDEEVDHCYTMIADVAVAVVVVVVVGMKTGAIPHVVVVVVAAVAVAVVVCIDLLPVQLFSEQEDLNHVQTMLNLFVLVDVVSMMIVEYLMMKMFDVYVY